MWIYYILGSLISLGLGCLPLLVVNSQYPQKFSISILIYVVAFLPGGLLAGHIGNQIDKEVKYSLPNKFLTVFFNLHHKHRFPGYNVLLFDDCNCAQYIHLTITSLSVEYLLAFFFKSCYNTRRSTLSA